MDCSHWLSEAEKIGRKMRAKFSQTLFGRLLIVIFLSLLSYQVSEAQVLDAINIQGNSRVDNSSIFPHIKSEVGKALSPETLESDIKQLYWTGFFDTVEAHLERHGDHATLVFEVRERPAIRSVKLIGKLHFEGLY